jgi:hypothetical protein
MNGSAEYVHGTRTTKIDRYKWTMVDSPGEMEMIDKGLLEIDPVYQRPENQDKVKAIARDWSWIACGALIVALRPDGSYYVMDGGHRASAAKLRADIKRLPCVVFMTECVEEEARGFLNANTLRRPMTMLEKFKALVAINDPIAVKVKDLIREAGYRIETSVKGGCKCVLCVKTLMDCYRTNPTVFMRVWPLILELCEDNPIQERLVQSIFYIESKMERQNLSLTVQPWKGRLLRLGYIGAINAAAKAAAYYSKGGPKVWSDGIVTALNVKTRNRLILDRTPEEIEAG